MDFILNDFSRWYIKIIRDRVWPLYEGKDKNAAFYTLITVTDHLVKLLAPISPFISEDIYQNVLKKFKKGLESVHMYDLPKPDKRRINKKLEKEMEIIKRIAEVSNFSRQKSGLKLRWPIKRLIIVTKDKEVKRAVKALDDILLNMCNVKSVKVATKKPKGKFSESEFDENKVLLDLTEDEELFEERLYRELTRKIQSTRKENNLVVKDRISLTLKSDEKTEETLKKSVSDLKKDVGAKTIEIGKLKGKSSSELVFRDKKIKISFF